MSLNRDERKIDLCLEEGAEKWIRISLISDDYDYAYLPNDDEKI